MKRPTFNHTREDSELNPCAACAELMSAPALRRALGEMRSTISELRARTVKETNFMPTLRWTQFETQALFELRNARMNLARAGGLAQSDGMSTWAGRALTLAAQVQDLVNEIENNAERVQKEACQ